MADQPQHPHDHLKSLSNNHARSGNGPFLLPSNRPYILDLSEIPVEDTEAEEIEDLGEPIVEILEVRANTPAEARENYFAAVSKQLYDENSVPEPVRYQATNLTELMSIRAFHMKQLKSQSLGTALGFRMRKGVVTEIPAILAFVGRKVHEQWLSKEEILPSLLVGPGGACCDVDVIEISNCCSSQSGSRREVNTELTELLRGNDRRIGPGSQVASQEGLGSIGSIVRSRTGGRQVGFLTNRHVALDMEHPNQMFHPLSPRMGPGVYMGSVERATSYVTDDHWFGFYVSTYPDSVVRADGAFIPFDKSFDLAQVRTWISGIGDMGHVLPIDLEQPLSNIIGKRVVKVGRSSGITKGTIFAYGFEYGEDRDKCLFTDLLVVGENNRTFDLEGDSGSLILVCGERGAKPRPVGLMWGGTSNRGCLRLKVGCAPRNWTSAVDLGRLLDQLELDLVIDDRALQGTAR